MSRSERDATSREVSVQVTIFMRYSQMTINVAFQDCGPGICRLCQKEKKEVFTVELGEFSGPMCLLDIGRLARLKLAKKHEGRPKAPERVEEVQ